MSLGEDNYGFDRKTGKARPLWNAASQILMVFEYVLLAMALHGSISCKGGNGTAWMNTVVLVTCLCILKGNVGPRTARFTYLCLALYSDNPATFLLMLALVPFFVCLTAVIFLREVPPSSTSTKQQQEVEYFGICNFAAVIVAVYLLVFVFTAPLWNATSQILLALGCLLLMLALVPFFVCLTEVIFLREVPPSLTSTEEQQDVKYLGICNVTAVIVAVYLLAIVFTAPLWNAASQILLALGKTGKARPLWNAASHILMVYEYVLLAMALHGSISCIGGNGTAWMNTVVLVTCLCILKGYVGPRTASFTYLCLALYSDNPATFLLMLALVPFFVCLTAVIFLREVLPSSTSTEEQQEVKYFGICNVAAVIVAVYLLVFVFTAPLWNAASQILLALGYLLLMLALVLFFVCLTEVIFLREVPPSLTSTEEQQDVKYFGICNVTAVIVAVSLLAFVFTVPLWNAASQILLALWYVLLTIALHGSLYIGSIVVGICYGVRLVITMPTAPEHFNPQSATWVLVFLCTRWFLYDTQATSTAGGGNICVGAH